MQPHVASFSSLVQDAVRKSYGKHMWQKEEPIFDQGTALIITSPKQKWSLRSS
jgi:hypothetical protein